MKIQLDNRTHWRSDHLREFLKRGMHQERVDLCKRGAPTIRIVVKYNRGGDRHASVSGRATIGGNWCKIMVPSGSVDRIDLAHVVAHELAHTAGIEHAAMEGRPPIGVWATGANCTRGLTRCRWKNMSFNLFAHRWRIRLRTVKRCWPRH